MKVYIITREGFPHGMAATKRIQNYCRCLIMQDIDCEVIIYTRTEVYGKTPKNLCGQGMFDNIAFRYISGTPLRESCIVTRRINDYRDRYKLLKFLKTNLNPDDIVIGYNNFDLFSSKIIEVTQQKGAHYYQELCELPFAPEVENKKALKRRLKFEKRILSKVDGVLSISRNLTDYAVVHCKKTTRIINVPIIVDSGCFEVCEKSEEADYPYIFHSGTHYEQKDGFISMLKAFVDVVNNIHQPVRFISTGMLEGSRHEAEIKSIINDNDLSDKVFFTGYLSETELKHYLSKATLVVINKLPNIQNKYCFSTKLGEYMAASKAIITTNVGEAANWLTDGYDACIIEPGDINLLSRTIANLLNNRPKRILLGQNAKLSCSRYFSIENCSRIFKENLLN